MKSLHHNSALRRAVLFLSLVPSLVSAQDESDCQPYRWNSGGLRMLQAAADPLPTQGIPIPVTVGEINCRYWSTTPAEVNYYTCSQLAQRYSISNDLFFQLNPGLASDCSDVQPETEYCVRGFIEPVRAFDGKCGPPNNNATCLGTDKQCCNSQTWTCGNSTADCAPGTCYEGVCDGDLIYSTDGTCGQDHGFRSCAGRWGNCCSIDGRCGTGPEYCGLFTCQEGDCDIWKEDQQPEGTPWTPDGTCGGAEGYRCSPDWGRCCNVNGVCGVNPADCYVERGCQPAFGICASNSNSTTTSSATSGTTSSATSTTSSTKTTSSSSTTKTTSTSTTPSSSTPGTTTAPSTEIPGVSNLPACGQTCFNNMLAQYSALGCSSPQDSYCLCNNADFSNGIRDCSNGACGSSVGSTVISFGSAYCSTAFATHTATTTGLGALPSCGQTCFNNMVAQYSALGCPSPSDSYCLCGKADFSNGLRDCSNGACGAVVGSSAIAYGSAYCSAASATHTTTATGVAALPSCGQTCFNNMVAQYSALGCASPQPSCLCKNVNFGYGLRDCANGACGTAVAPTVISYGSSYCASATATVTPS
ncbi:hypothetical protein CHGG_00770 [Chaetomium globosum CBS 148.51]|uniref:Chitin-binding type-1 domain-containing protein n=1 Tax=Chaetomium globosum (strain ATCC 6205 / CBS 148.51 / DSM 1962 / NBRC 6347 / NRRL 1970) TaxID=306901 RepID=Q2HG84_CHAGB|nr:uncharacterized protein CHGG_00770 [Chaetomium globosum CBS 148.51]EAQ92535.1 hypothetical protein CHGG_00770 [Chaetomium globosum CBS 148.51]